MALCDRCNALDILEVYLQSIPPDRSRLPNGWVHSESYASLRDSAVNCPLCSILIGNTNTNKKVTINDDDCVELLVFTRECWPRATRSIGAGGPLAGLEVMIGPKGKNASNSIRHIPLWTDDGGFKELHFPVVFTHSTDKPARQPRRTETTHNAETLRVRGRRDDAEEVA